MSTSCWHSCSKRKQLKRLVGSGSGLRDVAQAYLLDVAPIEERGDIVSLAKEQSRYRR
jgi:hypothetical protein